MSCEDMRKIAAPKKRPGNFASSRRRNARELHTCEFGGLNVSLVNATHRHVDQVAAQAVGHQPAIGTECSM
eukprot:1395526-Amphidinium_carterae.1